MPLTSLFARGYFRCVSKIARTSGVLTRKPLERSCELRRSQTEHRLILEVDGSQHFDHAAYDERRTRILERHGYTVVRFWNSDLLAHTGDVIDHTAQLLEEHCLMRRVARVRWRGTLTRLSRLLRKERSNRAIHPLP